MNELFSFLQNMTICISNFLTANSTALISGFIGIIGAVVGGNMTSKAALRLERWKTLRDAYADFFTSFHTYTHEPSEENLLSVVASKERAALICPKRSRELMEEAVNELLKGSHIKLHEAITRLRESAEDDLKKSRHR